MISLKKNEYKKINAICYLCYLSSNDESECLYVVAVNSYPSCMESFEIYGYGNTSEEAMIMALDQLSTAALKGLNFSTIEELNSQEIVERIKNRDGCIESPEKTLEIKCNEPGLCEIEPLSVIIDQDKAYPIIE